MQVFLGRLGTVQTVPSITKFGHFNLGMADLGAVSSQFGVINSLRTGNVVLDMCICMLIPVAFKIFESAFQRIQPAFAEFLEKLKRNDQVCVKVLEYEFRMNAWGSVETAGKEERNNILQKALTLHISAMKLKNLKTAKLSFMAIQEKGSRNDDTYEMVYGGTYEQLEQYQISTVPQNDVWIELKEGLRFKQAILEPDSDNETKIKKTTIRYEFEGKNPGGEEKIDVFISEAFVGYKAKMRALADFSRYLYMFVKNPPVLVTGESGGETTVQARQYKRYKLSDNKPFDCLFFREKKLLLKLMSHFMEKTGKYLIKGFPHKLGLLLHGPPGTGKTSLIKAMAQHTGRSVVSIPLARIETNQELMDIVFDQSFAVKGEDMPIKLSFKDVIFVMEDVDAASPIVLSRADKKEKGSFKTPMAKSGEVAKDVAKDVTKDDDEVATELDVPLGPAGEGDDLMAAMLNSLTDAGGDKKSTPYSSKYASKYDKLDLAGLLNVLDGVVDCPNRILIMTTNHPEKLDSALIRPGRIDKIIYLGYIQAPEASEMLEHYFKAPLSEAQLDRLTNAMTNPPGVADMTPAEVEQLCAEYDTVDEFLEVLDEKVLVERNAYFLKEGSGKGGGTAAEGVYGNAASPDPDAPAQQIDLHTLFPLPLQSTGQTAGPVLRRGLSAGSVGQIPVSSITQTSDALSSG